MQDSTFTAQEEGLAERVSLLFFPAMGVSVNFYAPFGDRLRALGVDLILVDLPGQGVNPLRARRGDQYGYREVVQDLIPQAVAHARKLHPDRPLFLGGHSLGAQLATLSTGHVAPEIHGLVLVAAGTAHWRAWPAGVLRVRAALTVHSLAAVAWLLPWYPGSRIGFGGDQAKRFMRDWTCNARTGQYRLEGSEPGALPVRDTLAGVSLPVFTLSIAGDPVAPQAALDELTAHLPRSPVQSVVLDGAVGDSAWKQHFSWARKPIGVETQIAKWARGVASLTPPKQQEKSASIPV